jgi:radical SAM superfamily enzyme YgiQ (UPF0313 family)
MKHLPQYRGILAVVPPYTISGPPAGIAYLLGMLKANGINDIGFVDLRLGGPDWPMLTYSAIGTSGENYVFDVPDLPLILHLLRRYPSTNIWEDFEELPWVRSYCRSRSLSPIILGSSLRRTQAWLARWASSLDSPVIVGFSTWISNYLTTLMAAAELKRLPAPPFVVLGGPQCSDSEIAADLALASGLADAVVVGEGEQTFLELQSQVDPVNRTLSGSPPPGTKIWRNGALQSGGRRQMLHLDDLPLPNFDAMDLDVYSGKVRQVSYELSRGCTDRCEFCSEWVFWEHFRSSSPAGAVNQLVELHRRTGYGHVTFSDSLLNGNAKRLTAFAEQLLASNLSFSWSGFVRADITKPVANMLSRAGLEHVFIGVESLSDMTLRSMRKRRKGSDNVQAIEAFLGAGISVAAGVVAGFPGDSRDEFEHTTKVLQSFVKRYPGKFHASVEPFVITPSASISKKPQEFGLSLLPWEDEVIEMVPELASITRRCMALVQGQDQSVERKKKFRYARTKLQPSVESETSPTPACSLPQGESLRTISLDHEWVLALGNDRTTREAWLLRSEEINGLPPGPISSKVVEDRVGSVQIRWNRPLACAAGARGVTFDLVARFGLHPCVVARHCRRSKRLIVMNLDTELLYRMDAPTVRLAEFLSTEMRSMDEILILQSALKMTSEQLHETISQWWSKRLLMGTPELTEQILPTVLNTPFTVLTATILREQDETSRQ